jgi:DcaP outer membrane protein
MKRLPRAALSAALILTLTQTMTPVRAQDAPDTAGAPPNAALSDLRMQIGELAELVRTQQRQLERQTAQLSQQAESLGRQQTQIDAQADAIRALQTRVDRGPASGEAAAPSEDEQSVRARLEAVESEPGNLRDEETTTTYDVGEFTGAFALPGTNAALRVGGFVKVNSVQSLAALGSQNRFIVGTIPTHGPGSGDPEAALTAQQSRLSFELRDNTSVGAVRAFLEGDFAGAGDTLRLRHAFGQFQELLVGKTWTTFMDVDSSPEEVDFEGVNGRINVRQPQIRWFPSIGNHLNLELALEDPAPDITGGDGVSQIPDFIASIRTSAPRLLFSDAWQFKSALLLRNLKARWDIDPNHTETTVGWAVNFSTRRPILKWDPRDNLALQVSYGGGYGRYVNDLGTVGGQDAVFDDSTGDMETLAVLSTFVSFQKWWRDGLRSTFIASYVDVDNPEFQPGDAYSHTNRISGNVIWSPVPRIDIGAELLWGKRTDKDGSSGDASQIQLSARYRF